MRKAFGAAPVAGLEKTTHCIVASDGCIWTTFSLGLLECRIEVKESMVWLLAFSAPTEGRALLRKATSLRQFIQIDIVLYDCFNECKHNS